MHFTTRHGLRLAADVAGDAHNPPVLFFHGGGQTRHSWGKAVTTLADQGYCAYTIDMRGHGDSDWAPNGDYSIETLAQDLVDVGAAVQRADTALPAFVGASMGGMAALAALGTSPIPMASALVLVDVVPRMEAEGAYEIHSFMTSHPQGFETLEQVADVVAAYQPHRKRKANPQGLLKNLRWREGRYYWHWDPKLMQRDMKKDLSKGREHLDEAARNIKVPTLLIRGALSRVVSMAGVAALQRDMPHAEFVNIADADHMVAGDANDDFNAPLIEFLNRTIKPAQA